MNGGSASSTTRYRWCGSPRRRQDGTGQWVGLLTDDAVARVIEATYRRTGELVDPHTAIGLAAAAVSSRDTSVPTICVATAHPAKFPDTVEAATGVRPGLPPHMADLFSREERVETLPNDLKRVQFHIASRTRVLED